MADKLVKRTVMVDAYSWMTRDPDRPLDPPQHNTAVRGELIEVSPDEAKRGERLGGLGSPEEAAQAALLASEPGSAPDEELRGMNIEQLTAYLGQHPSEAERISDLEATRPKGKVRSTITDLVERTIEARDVAVEEQLARQQAEENAAAAAAAGAPRVPGTSGVPALP